jgi:hypothetical protein
MPTRSEDVDALVTAPAAASCTPSIRQVGRVDPFDRNEQRGLQFLGPEPKQCAQAPEGCLKGEHQTQAQREQEGEGRNALQKKLPCKDRLGALRLDEPPNAPVERPVSRRLAPGNRSASNRLLGHVCP